jgi:hypothetical protein
MLKFSIILSTLSSLRNKDQFHFHALYLTHIFFRLGDRTGAQWLKRRNKNRNVAGSIPDGVIGTFQ